MLLVLLPPAAALACLAVAALASDETTAGYAIGSLARSMPPLLMAAWPLWAGLLRWRGAATRRAALLGLLGLALMGLPRPPQPAPQPGEATVVLTNVNAYTGNDAVLEGFLASLQADAVITIERRGDQIGGMVRVADNHDAPMPRPSHASAAYCRDTTACAADISPQIGSASMAMPVVRMRIAGACLLGLHAPPPYPRDPSGMHPYISALLAQLDGGRMRSDWGACRAGDPAVLAGDLNAVPGSRPYHRLLAAGLVDVQRWAGVYGLSWPTGGGWPPVPLLRLDHVFVGKAPARLVRSLRVPDSDHKALVIAIKK